MSSCSACNKRYLGQCSTPFEYKHLAHIWCDDYANFKFGECSMSCGIKEDNCCCFECKEVSSCKDKHKCDVADDFENKDYKNCQNYIKADSE